MIEYRKNDFFIDSGTGKDFKVELKPILRPNKSYCEELILNAKEIWEQKDGPLYVLYSGGIDSELILKVFLSLNMSPIPVIISLQPNLNNHDIKYAFDFCKKNSLTPLVVDINIVDFEKSNEFIDISILANTTNHYDIPAMKVALSLDGTVLCGYEEPTLSLINNTWYYVEKETWAGWRKLYRSGKLTGTSAFHSWSAETLLSFMIDPDIIKLVENKIPDRLSSLASRHAVYGKLFHMDPRPKFTGWEYVHISKEFDSMKQIASFMKTDKKCGEYKIEYNSLIEMLSIRCR